MAKGGFDMYYWDRFYFSGKIEDYLHYAKYEKEVAENDDLKRTDTEGR